MTLFPALLCIIFKHYTRKLSNTCGLRFAPLTSLWIFLTQWVKMVAFLLSWNENMSEDGGGSFSWAPVGWVWPPQCGPGRGGAIIQVSVEWSNVASCSLILFTKLFLNLILMLSFDKVPVQLLDVWKVTFNYWWKTTVWRRCCWKFEDQTMNDARRGRRGI